jgi:hypothetical protein
VTDNRKTAPPNSAVPLRCTKESFFGFEMADEEVGPGQHRKLAVEIKQLFEAMVADADEKNEEIFLTKELDHALRRFLVDPSQASLDHLLEVSPTLVQPAGELSELIRAMCGPNDRS